MFTTKGKRQKWQRDVASYADALWARHAGMRDEPKEAKRVYFIFAARCFQVRSKIE